VTKKFPNGVRGMWDGVGTCKSTLRGVSSSFSREKFRKGVWGHVEWCRHVLEH
jgi:hypothetical protein